MCLLFFSYKTHPEYCLIFVGNRDEFYDRPTAALSFWKGETAILAGRDLRGNGTWLGITRTGRFAAITNYRDPEHDALYDKNSPSRGNLVSEFLLSKDFPEKYLEHIETIGYTYKGFSLIVGDKDNLCYFCNRSKGILRLNPGLYGLSNHLLNTPWPKVEKGLTAFKKVVKNQNKIKPEKFFTMLKDRSRPPDDKLPDTGVELDWERMLSSIFISGDDYGTRSSSVILIKKNGCVTCIEQTYNLKKKSGIEKPAVSYSFSIST